MTTKACVPVSWHNGSWHVWSIRGYFVSYNVTFLHWWTILTWTCQIAKTMSMQSVISHHYNCINNKSKIVKYVSILTVQSCSACGSESTPSTDRLPAAHRCRAVQLVEVNLHPVQTVYLRLTDAELFSLWRWTYTQYRPSTCGSQMQSCSACGGEPTPSTDRLPAAHRCRAVQLVEVNLHPVQTVYLRLTDAEPFSLWRWTYTQYRPSTCGSQMQSCSSCGGEPTPSTDRLPAAHRCRAVQLVEVNLHPVQTVYLRLTDAEANVVSVS